MRVFFVIWFGQLVSMIGSGLTSFALGVWLYQTTGSATQFALISLFALLPFLLISPLAGAVVDRWDRRKVMITSDSVAALTTLAIVLLYNTDLLSIWWIYLLTGIASTARAFQMPAYTATITVLVPKEQYGRANGLVQLAQGTGQLISPLLAGVLVGLIDLSGVVMLDLASFVVAVLTLMCVRVPRPEISSAGAQARGSLWQESFFGWKYISARPGLLSLLILFLVSNFLISTVIVLLTPLVLSLPSASPAVLGTVLSISGAGMLVGSVMMSIWGGPQRRIHGVLGGMTLGAVSLILAGLQPSALLLAVTAFVFVFTMPIVAVSSLAIWQSKVAADIQGRVFATRSMITMSATPLAYLIAGPLADFVFQPLLKDADAPLASTVGQVIGYGPGRGIGLMYIIFGLLTLVVLGVGCLYPRLRLVEDELPDATGDLAQDSAEIVPADTTGTIAQAL
jgi:predicted MFS family arabinose efflux permease